MQVILRSMNKGQLSKPLKLKDNYILFRLEDFKPAEFTPEIKEKLLLDQFTSWASEVAQEAHDRLT